jgi:multimeric flavodoxin WrbA
MPSPPEHSVVILGTSRSDGNNRLVVDKLLLEKPVRIVDLSQLHISPFDYAHRNAGDDFLPLVESLATKELWILATPIYWHAMSAQLKTFIDRLGDLFSIRQDLGERLRGKTLAVVATGTSPALPPGFESGFRHTAAYLGMRYAGAFYWRFREDDRPFPHLAAAARKAGAAWIGGKPPSRRD